MKGSSVITLVIGISLILGSILIMGLSLLTPLRLLFAFSIVGIVLGVLLIIISKRLDKRAS